MNRNMKNLLETIYEVDEKLCNISNYGDCINTTSKGWIYVCNGKIYDTEKSWESAFSQNEYHSESDVDGRIIYRDFRNVDKFDERLPGYVYEYIKDCFVDKYHLLRNEEYALYVGAIINQFYICGLHTCVGDFDSGFFNEFVQEDRLRRYLCKLCECIRARAWYYSKALYEDYSKITNDRERECNNYFLQDINYFVKYKDVQPEDIGILHDELVQIEPDYRFGQIYQCIYDVKESNTEYSMNRIHSKYIKILGLELYHHVVGKPKFQDVTFMIQDGKLEIDTAFTEGFGLGIPYITIVDGVVAITDTNEYVKPSEHLVKEFIDRKDESLSNDPELEEIDREYYYIYTFKDVRDTMALQLDVGVKTERMITNVYTSGSDSSYVGEYDGMSFKEYFQKLVYDSGRSEREIATTVNLNPTYTNAIISGRTKDPSTVILLTFAISLQLNYEQTQILLKKAGRCISERDDPNGEKERMLSEFICSRIYDITTINIELDALGLSTLGSKE